MQDIVDKVLGLSPQRSVQRNSMFLDAFILIHFSSTKDDSRIRHDNGSTANMSRVNHNLPGLKN